MFIYIEWIFVVEIFFRLENSFTKNKLVLLKMRLKCRWWNLLKKYNSRLRAQDFLTPLVIQELALGNCQFWDHLGHTLLNKRRKVFTTEAWSEALIPSAQVHFSSLTEEELLFIVKNCEPGFLSFIMFTSQRRYYWELVGPVPDDPKDQPQIERL